MEGVTRQEQAHAARVAQLRAFYHAWMQGQDAAEVNDEAAIALAWQAASVPLRLVLIDQPRPDRGFASLALFSDGSILWIPQAQALYTRARQLQRILATGHAPRDPWGDLQSLIDGAYNFHHTGDPGVR